MTVDLPFAQSPLGAEQLNQLQALTQTLTEPQAQWVSGYFAGLVAGLTRGGAGAAYIVAPPAAASRTVTILYASETGNSAALARSLEAALKGAGLNASLTDVAKYKPRQLKDERDVLVIASTHGEGDPPQSAVGFFEFLEGARAPKLDGVRFAVLALGDSSYEYFCEAGKRIDRRLEELGAERLSPRIDCDVDYDDGAAAWIEELTELLKSEASAASPGPQPAFAPGLFPTASAHDKRNPYFATILENIPIVGRHSTKETRHIEIDIDGSGLSYQPGDALGVIAVNEPARVEELLSATGLNGAEEVSVKSESLPLSRALAERFEITTAAPRLLEQWARLSGAAELAALLGDDKRAERTEYLHNHHVIDVIQRFPVTGIDADDLLAGLRPLQPRLYSIASSAAAVPGEVHLTISPVRYELHGRGRNGVASAHLCDRLKMGEQLPVYIQENPHFRLPADDARPIIMIGAGTGVAPYRGFLQERDARGASGRSWLFFGERNFRSDFLYQIEWQEHLQSGILTELDVAFSRDAAEKAYVQHRMLERSADLYAWLQDGAHIYVCGDAERMAPDVDSALRTIVEREGGMSAEEAADYLRRLSAEERYQRDVY